MYLLRIKTGLGWAEEALVFVRSLTLWLAIVGHWYTSRSIVSDW